MSAEAAVLPCDEHDLTLLVAAEAISQRLPGHRVEIIGGEITVTPPPDFDHGNSLTNVMAPFIAAGLHGEESRVVQGVGLWLPGGASDYAVPDLSVVDADIADHLIEYNCYDPAVFRLVLEVTSSNYAVDLKRKPVAYAAAGIPVYVIVDRKNRRILVLTDPGEDGYRVNAVHRPGESFVLPASIGASVKLDVDALLGSKP